MSADQDDTPQAVILDLAVLPPIMSVDQASDSGPSESIVPGSFMNRNLRPLTPPPRA